MAQAERAAEDAQPHRVHSPVEAGEGPAALCGAAGVRRAVACRCSPHPRGERRGRREPDPDRSEGRDATPLEDGRREGAAGMIGRELTPQQSEAARAFIQSGANKWPEKLSDDAAVVRCKVGDLVRVMAWYGGIRYEAGQK